MQTQAMTVGLYCKQKVVRCRLQERHVMEEEKRQQRKSTKRSIAEEMECNVEHLESIKVKKALQPLRCSPILSNILPKFACTVQNLLDIVACNLVTFYNLKSNFKIILCSTKKVDSSLQKVQSEWQKTRVGML